MSTKKKLLLGSAGAAAAGGAGLDIDEVFSTYLYDGTGSTQVIENGIALGNSNDGGSASFSASSTTRVNISTSANFNYGTGDFTIEAFILIKSSKNYHNIYDQRTSTQDYNTNSPVIYIDSNNYIIYMVGGSGRAYSSALSLNTWYHVAVTRASGSTKMFLNGTQQGSAYSDSLTYVQPASDFSFGGSLEQNQYNTDGLISNLRVVKGTALYTSNFTAPTAELTAVSGTSLLTAQGATPFVDNSGNNVTLTQQNGPTASEFGPFTGSDGEGGLVWTKVRSNGFSHALIDTERGVNNFLKSNATNAQDTGHTDTITSFNSNGYSLGSDSSEWFWNRSGEDYVSWTWRKAPKWFDVVTYTGNTVGNSAQTISHGLGSTPGLIIVKRYSTADNWIVWHRSITNGFAALNDTGAWLTNNYTSFITSVGSTSFTVGESLNTNGASFVAYVFAHNDGDGDFGPDGDQDIIKCGSISHTNGSDTTVDLGFEPQWLMVKCSSTSGNWFLVDNMRGITTGGNDARLYADSSSAESDANSFDLTSSGFILKSGFDTHTYIYMAIRRGPLAEPTSATDVFTVHDDVGEPSSSPLYLNNNHVIDAVLCNVRYISGGYGTFVEDRLRGGGNVLKTNATDAEASVTRIEFDHNTNNLIPAGGYGNNSGGTSENNVFWQWKRAPSFFDVVAWSGDGTGSARIIPHNLTVEPEMIISKQRNSTSAWSVYVKDLWTSGSYLSMELNTTAAAGSNGSIPNSSVHRYPFRTGDPNAGDNITNFCAQGLNSSGDTYIAYLFASLDGISKVGSYTGNASDNHVIDCGFSNGARFVLIKRTTLAKSWYVWDSERGIVTGNDPYLQLNNTIAENTTRDWIDPNSSGFAVNNIADVNSSGDNFIFYAIA